MIFRKRMMSAAMAVLMTCSMCVTSTLAEDNKRKEAQEDRVCIARVIWIYSRSIRITLYRKRY